MPQPLYSTTIYRLLSRQPAIVSKITRDLSIYASSELILELRIGRNRAAYGRSNSLAFLAKLEEPLLVLGSYFDLLSVDRNYNAALIRIY